MKKRMAVIVLAFSVALAGLAIVLAQADLPPGPTPVYRASFTPAEIPAAFDVVSIMLDFAPGAWTPLHSHGGQGVVLVVDGTMTVRDEAGSETTYGSGETWIEMPGHRHKAGNETDANARVVFTIVLGEGAELTTVHE